MASPKISKHQVRDSRPQTTSIFAGLDRIDHSLLDCIKLAEDTLDHGDAKEYNTLEARFNLNFDESMNVLNHPDPFDPTRDYFTNSWFHRRPGIIHFRDGLDYQEIVDDLEEWSDDIDLCMKSYVTHV